MKKILLIPLVFILMAGARGQNTSVPKLIDADSLRGFANIVSRTLLFIDSSEEGTQERLSSAAFTPLSQFAQRVKIPKRLISRVFYLKFSIRNNSAQEKLFYYYPGKLCKEIKLYRLNNENVYQEIETKKMHDGFIPLKTEAQQTSSYMVKVLFFKTGFNELDPTLIAHSHIQTFKNNLYQTMNTKKTGGIILSGMLLMMILVTLLNYFVTQKIEFLYNSLYSLCMFLLIFLTTNLTMNPSWFKGVFISYLDLLLLVLATVAYLAFTRYFLNTKTLHPNLNRFLKTEAWVVIALMLLYSFLYFVTDSYKYEIFVENVIKLVILAAGLVYIFLSLTQKNTLMNYLATGVCTQIFFSIISLGFVLSNSPADEIYTSPIFYFELGIICSIVFFLLGLFYKNREELILRIKEQEAMKLEVEKQSFENKLTVYKTQQEERNRISADMHDDLGAGMTSIRLYSELAKGKMNNLPGMPIPELEKISSSADELINNMNAIIWSMSSQNDSLGNMVAYIRSYATGYMENTGITPIVSIPDNLPALVVSGTIRRNIFLVIKEALQNVVKHSQATEVRITMKKEPEGLSLSLHDNGKGIDFDNLRPFSNGLKNMRKRMHDINIEFSIENCNGTNIRLYAKTR